MIFKGAIRCVNKSKPIDGERSLSTFVTKTHDFVEIYLTNALLRYKCIRNSGLFFLHVHSKTFQEPLTDLNPYQPPPCHIFISY